MDINAYVEAGKKLYKAYNEGIENVNGVMREFDKQCAE